MRKHTSYDIEANKKEIMVPVLSKSKETLMPCSEKRARKLIEKGEAKKYWQKGIFCIKLLKEPSDNKKQSVIVSIDPGSKREGYTVATKKNIIFNITTNTLDWVKDKMENRKNLRRSRRQRKTPFRKCRSNRGASRKEGRLAPSTKARWDAKLRIIKFINSILPLTDIVIEDISATTKKGQKAWNKNFSPLEVGKKYFEKAVLELGYNFCKFQGFETFAHRNKREFKKLTGKRKMEFIWESHCVDSHSLIEMYLDKEIKPFLGIWKIEFLNFYRRQLRMANTKKEGKVQPYGSTVSHKMRRGSIVRYKEKLGYLGGETRDKVTVNSIITGKRYYQYCKKEDIRMMYNNNWRVQFLPRASSWVSLGKYL